MAVLEAGRVCIKTVGKEAGQKCVVITVDDEKNVTIVGKNVKKRKCNITHLEPTNQQIDISGLNTPEQIIEKLN
ncbi:MAG: 50S ribosomal protein L14e [Candidatus Diapherotrites archaeon]|nr:50S ribosomal protein L14e [Candidatus Diapherotrites archaeon]